MQSIKIIGIGLTTTGFICATKGLNLVSNFSAFAFAEVSSIFHINMDFIISVLKPLLISSLLSNSILIALVLVFIFILGIGLLILFRDDIAPKRPVVINWGTRWWEDSIYDTESDWDSQGEVVINSPTESDSSSIEYPWELESDPASVSNDATQQDSVSNDNVQLEDTSNNSPVSENNSLTSDNLAALENSFNNSPDSGSACNHSSESSSCNNNSVKS